MKTLASFSIALLLTSFAHAHPCEGRYQRVHIDYLSDTADGAAAIVKDADGSEVRFGALAFCPLSMTVGAARFEASSDWVLNQIDNNRVSDGAAKSFYDLRSFLDDASDAQPILASSVSVDAKNSLGVRITSSGTVTATGGSVEIVRHHFLNNDTTLMKLDCSTSQSLKLEARYYDRVNRMDYVCSYVRD
jgi:hypothetical protein